MARAGRDEGEGGRTCGATRKAVGRAVVSGRRRTERAALSPWALAPRVSGGHHVEVAARVPHATCPARRAHITQKRRDKTIDRQIHALQLETGRTESPHVPNSVIARRALTASSAGPYLVRRCTAGVVSYRVARNPPKPSSGGRGYNARKERQWNG